MDVLDVIGDPELRETLLAVRGRPRATSIGEVAEATGVHRNVARRRLERLVEAGLLTASFERDLEGCDPYDQDSWHKLPWWKKALAWISYRLRRFM